MKTPKILISMVLFLLTLTMEAATGDELLRIKRNFATLLIPSDADPHQLKSILSSLAPEQEVSDQAVVELFQRYPFDREKLKFYLSSLSASGMWPDINYNDAKRSGWEPKTHAERILELVKLYYSQQTPYYQAPEVEAAIHKALHYWFTAKPVCLNWWYNQIGIPKTLGTAFVLFEEKLTPDEKREAIAVMKHAKFGLTGQNKVWLAGNVMMRALLQNDVTLVKMARDTIASEIVTGGTEGIKQDGCFHQHGAQQQFGNYGLSFVSSMSFFSGVLAGTSLAFDEAQLGVVGTLIDEGYRWVLWKGNMDVNALGRQLFHAAQVHKTLSLAFAVSELGGGESKYCSAIAQSLLAENYSATQTPLLIGHKHFWQSDYTIHRRPQWMASVKMASERVIGVEMMNGDNMQGYYLADGATYIYQDGKEYQDIFPLWNWRKVPGVTAFQSDAPMPLIQDYQPGNKAAFVGGVSDGKQGMTAMEIDRAGIKAHKSWVFTDDFVLCLGAGIEADSNLVVTTAIEQSLRRGALSVWQSGKWTQVDGKQTYQRNEQRFHHHQTGYIVWGNRQHAVAQVEQRTGRWYDVMQMYRPEEVKGEVTSLHLEHGVAPRDGAYQYLLLPAANLAETAAFNLSSIRVLRNDTVAQAVYTEKGATWWITAYHPVALTLAPGLPITIHTPGLYMLRQENGAYRLWYADPTQKQAFAELTVGKREVRISLPKEKGQTVCTKL